MHVVESAYLFPFCGIVAAGASAGQKNKASGKLDVEVTGPAGHVAGPGRGDFSTRRKRTSAAPAAPGRVHSTSCAHMPRRSCTHTHGSGDLAGLPRDPRRGPQVYDASRSPATGSQGARWPAKCPPSPMRFFGISPASLAWGKSARGGGAQLTCWQWQPCCRARLFRARPRGAAPGRAAASSEEPHTLPPLSGFRCDVISCRRPGGLKSCKGGFKTGPFAYIICGRACASPSARASNPGIASASARPPFQECEPCPRPRATCLRA